MKAVIVVAVALFVGALFFYNQSFYPSGEHAFVVEKGTGAEKKAADGSLKIMSWNVCALPGNNPLLYCGLAPVTKRVAAIASFIRDADPDILCLQEAHDQDFIYDLYFQLRDRYAHFVFDIGRFSSAQYNSGLFVASKYPLFDLGFTRFDMPGRGVQEAIRKGIFGFGVGEKSEPLAFIVSTHLQPYTTAKDAHVRFLELTMAVEHLQNDINDNGGDYPRLIVGDLNIDRGDVREGSRALISSQFIDLLWRDEDKAKPVTATDYFIQMRKGEVSDNSAATDLSIDYILLSRKEVDDNDYTTTVLPAFDKINPDASLSDHHAICVELEKLPSI